MASSSVVLKYVVPAFGVLTVSNGDSCCCYCPSRAHPGDMIESGPMRIQAAAMYVVPLQAVVNARRTGVLGVSVLQAPALGGRGRKLAQSQAPVIARRIEHSSACKDLDANFYAMFIHPSSIP